MYKKPFDPEFYGDDPRWFIGVVETPSADDSLGRVRVRVYGLHSNDMQDIDTYDLPLAQVMVPGTEEGTTGLGMNPQLEVGAMVFGFFLDGKSSQLPFVLGSFPRTEIADPAVGIDLSNQVQNGLDTTSGPTGTPGAPNPYFDPSISGDPITVQDTYDILRDQGLSHEQAIGVLANINRESSFNPAAVGDNGNSFGLFQYNRPAGRADPFFQAVPDWQTNPEGQLVYTFNQEPTGVRYRGLEFGSSLEAANWFTNYFEIPANRASYTAPGGYNSRIVEELEASIVRRP
jgi:hypothetical protein